MSATLFVMNFSGNVGKTTLTRHMLEPMLGGDVVNVESLNASENSDEAVQIAAKFFTDLADRMATLGHGDKPLIVDVGSSNVQLVMPQLESIDGMTEDIHSFLIPVVPKPKMLKDTYATIQALVDIGVPAAKIFVVMNDIEDPDTVKRDFDMVFAAQKKFKVNVLEQGVLSHEVIAQIAKMKMTIGELAAHPISREMIAAEKDPEKRAEMGPMLTKKRMATTVQRNLRAVFDEFVDRSGFPVAETAAA